MLHFQDLFLHAIVNLHGRLKPVERAAVPTFSPKTNVDSLHIDGRKERVQFDKITARVSRLCYGLDSDHVDAAAITQKVISGVYQGVTTIELDNLVTKSLKLSYRITMLILWFH